MGDPDLVTLVREFLANGRNVSAFVEELARYHPKCIPSNLAEDLKRNKLAGELAACEARARALRSVLGI